MVFSFDFRGIRSPGLFGTKMANEASNFILMIKPNTFQVVAVIVVAIGLIAYLLLFF